MTKWAWCGLAACLALGAGCSDSNSGESGSPVDGPGVPEPDAGEADTSPDRDADAGPTAETPEPVGSCSGVANGTPCDDEDPCTEDDVCQGGVCVGGQNKVCDAGGPCQDGVCGADGECVYSPVEDGTSCNVACFTQATCQAGACQAVAGSEQQCPTPDSPCVDELRCDQNTGLCTVEIYAFEGSACDTDDDVCTLEFCDDKGECVDTGETETCQDLSAGNPCWTYICTSKSGCVKSIYIEDASCTDNNACTQSDKCTYDQFGQPVCLGTPINVDDLNPCTDDACVGGTVVHTPIPNAPCPIDHPCSEIGICVEGSCQPQDACECSTDADCGVPDDLCSGELYCDKTGAAPTCQPKPGTAVVCAPSDNPCLSNACSPATGACVETPVANGMACDDGSACTTTDVCLEGVCVGTALECDDGAFCNGVETCDEASGCVPGVPPVIDDGVECTVDACDEDNDTVVNQPMDAACDDQAFCNGAEVCDPLAGCVAGVPVTYDDGIDCTVDTCDEALDGPSYAPDDSACSDGDDCTGVEVCNPAAGCQAGGPPLIDDGIDCTLDSCDPDSGQVVNEPVDALCDDGAFCNGTEVCDPDAGCVAGEPPPLDDGIPCTDDDCGEGAGVVHIPNDALCEDDDLCNGSEVCNPDVGCEAGTPIPKGDGNACTDDFCDPATGNLTHVPNDAYCDDGDPCTQDVCDPDLACVYTPIGGGGGGAVTWYAEHSYTPGGGTTTTNQFFSTEKVATRMTLDAAVFPLTITRVRLLTDPFRDYILQFYSDGAGEPGGQLMQQGFTGDGSYQEVELTTPLTLDTAQTFWVGFQSTTDGMTAYGDGSGEATANMYYGCVAFFGECISPAEWNTFDSAGFPFSGVDDLVIDVGTGGGCE